MVSGIGQNRPFTAKSDHYEIRDFYIQATTQYLQNQPNKKPLQLKDKKAITNLIPFFSDLIDSTEERVLVLTERGELYKPGYPEYFLTESYLQFLNLDDLTHQELLNHPFRSKVEPDEESWIKFVFERSKYIYGPDAGYRMYIYVHKENGSFYYHRQFYDAEKSYKMHSRPPLNFHDYITQ